jgi:cellulose synthase/poly-beta-1,6-N-acetylglucosamine synthase-like glycosyltransferase
MTLWHYVLWALGFLICYVYLGYPLLVLLMVQLRARTHDPPGERVCPSLTVVIPAHDEESVIESKICNTLSLDYPAGKVQTIVASDGSADATEQIARANKPTVKLVRSDAQVGKSTILNQAVRQAAGQVVVFSDANAMLRRDALRSIVRNFADQKVGCVVGKVTYANSGDTTVAEGETFYWHYELWLRLLESALGNLAMGSGPIMALRRELFEPLDPDVGEDFVLPMRAAVRGYRVVYEPEAISEEILFQNTPNTMIKSKVRIITKDLRGLWLCRGILNPVRYPLYSWGLISHKLLRWLVPYFLMALFLTNLLLLHQPFYRFTLAAQWVCYGLAGLGYLWQQCGRKPPRFLGIPFSFCLVNAAAAVGVARFLIGKKSGTWAPVREATTR